MLIIKQFSLFLFQYLLITIIYFHILIKIIYLKMIGSSHISNKDIDQFRGVGENWSR